MPIVRPVDTEQFIETTIYIPSCPPLDHQVWAFFILNNLHTIALHSLILEHQCNTWTEGLLVPPPAEPIPTLNEQQSTVFRRVPYLEQLWSIWQDQQFTSSLESTPTGRRQLIALN